MKSEQRHWSHVMVSPATVEKPNGEDILALIANHFKVGVDDIKAHNKRSTIIDQRHAAAAYLFLEAKLKLREVGAILGGRDHSTINHSVGNHRLWMINHKPYRDMYNGMVDALKQAQADIEDARNMMGGKRC